MFHQIRHPRHLLAVGFAKPIFQPYHSTTAPVCVGGAGAFFAGFLPGKCRRAERICVLPCGRRSFSCPGIVRQRIFCGKLSKWQVFRVVGIHFWLRMVKIPEIRLTNPNIYRITYIWEQFRRECGTRAPARSCRRNHGLVLVPVYLVWCRR